MHRPADRDGTAVRVTPGGSRTVKSAETTFAIVEHLQSVGRAGVTEIADSLGLAKSSVHVHLVTLCEHGYVSKDDGAYRLGLRFLEVGLNERETRKLYQVARPKLRALSERTGERTWCVVEENGLGVFLCGATGTHAVKTDATPGKRMHLHYLSGGKAVLAHLPRARVESIVERHGLPSKTEHTITDEATLYAELERVRDRGYATDFEESLYGLHTVSAPVLTGDDEPLGAITVVGAAQRMTESVCHDEVSPRLLAAANEVELDVQYS